MGEKHVDFEGGFWNSDNRRAMSALLSAFVGR